MRRIAVGAVAATITAAALATTPLADQPIASNVSVPGNLALALSVEWPTAVSVAHIDATYDDAKTYLGYFDPDKCYLYNYHATEANRHFYPAGLATARTCTGAQDSKWSGNFMNWATMQSIDPFRWVLTGGLRSTDTNTKTILEKGHASGQGGTWIFPDRSLGAAAPVANATPLTWGSLNMRVQGLGNKMRFTSTGDVNSAPTAYEQGMAVSEGTTYEVSVRVRVCDESPAAGGLEANCTAFGSKFKPTGLIQRYSDQIRFSAFGYLNDSDVLRDGGILRARQKFVGPSNINPDGSAVANVNAEWDAGSGIFVQDPDPADASATTTATGVTVKNSGVINYLNKFGQTIPGDYKSFDPVSELYYAAIRYFRKLGNVTAWSDMGSASAATKTTWIDGFPVITNWDDPIQYSCQKNFVLGIGDVYAWADRNLPGATGSSEPAQPPEVAADTLVDTVVATDMVGKLHGHPNQPLGSWQDGGRSNGALMAGLAYWANTQDIRPDDPSDLGRTKGRQSVQTYWLDVQEGQTFLPDNQYYLAAKYGGFNVPESFDAWSRTTDIPLAWWHTNTDQVGSQDRPDTYFTASRPDQVLQGLTQAFASIASRLRAFTTAFATSLPQVASSGVASFSTQFDAKTWSGELTASETSLDAGTGNPTLVEAWRFSAKLDAQTAGTGWDTGRVMASWNPASAAGVPFRLASLSATQQSALDTGYRTGADGADYLAYLRGERKHEKSSTASGSARAYRDRTSVVGDVGNFKLRVVGRPDAPYSSSSNPGYDTFKSSWSGRPTVAYVGTNAGVIHAVNGALTGATAGRELFAYVPGAVVAGPSGTPAIDGLQTLGNPSFTHHYFVDATPVVADVDFGRTVGGSGTDWRTILVGGLGKGGKAIYALDITNPAGITTEATLASKVLWEFTHADLGFTYGEPAVVKTRKHGWVVAVGSGYNNSDGMGYLFLINPRTGALLEKIGTGVGAAASQAGLAHVQGFLLDRTDGTVDSFYAGDLLGNLWRWDMTAAAGILPPPLKLATLTDSSNAALAVTSRPLVVVHPETNRRYVTVGTGRLLHSSDVGSSQAQRFFAIIDGNAAHFGNADGSDLPSGMSYPTTPANLRQLTDLTTRVVLDLSTEIGWFVDLGALSGSSSMRIITDSTSFYGTVAFSAMQPGVSANPCEANALNRIYAIDLGSGQSKLHASNSSTTPVAYVSSLTGTITDLKFYSVAGIARLIAGSSTGRTESPPGGWSAADNLRRLNWREVPLND